MDGTTSTAPLCPCGKPATHSARTNHDAGYLCGECAHDATTFGATVARLLPDHTP